MQRSKNKNVLPAVINVALVALVALILGGSAAPAAAQFRGGPPGRGGGDWGRGDRGRSDWGRGDRGRGDWGRGDRGRGDPRRGDRGDREHSSRGRRDEKSSSGNDPYPLVARFNGGDVPGFGIDPRRLGGRIVDLEARYARQILDKTNSVFDRYDKNHNGVLEHSEWVGVSWQSDPRDSDLDHDGQLTRAEMAERLAKREAGSKSSRKSSSSSSQTSARADSGSRFGRREGSERSRGDRERGDRSHSGPRRVGYDPAMALKRFDRNGDGTIDPSELDERTRRFAGEYFKRLGIDPDKPIRIDELANTIKRARAERESGGDAKKKKANKVPERLAYKVEGATQAEGRRSFRARRAELPEEMPDWWKKRDKNDDGQVTLSEYLTKRSRRDVEAFHDYDLNNDGIITTQEATLVEQGY